MDNYIIYISLEVFKINKYNTEKENLITITVFFNYASLRITNL
jgi:hypothetical protein